jgi:hypothetical protein
VEAGHLCLKVGEKLAEQDGLVAAGAEQGWPEPAAEACAVITAALVEIALAAFAAFVEDVDTRWQQEPGRWQCVTPPEGTLSAGVAAVAAGANTPVGTSAGLAGALWSTMFIEGGGVTRGVTHGATALRRASTRARCERIR